MNKINWSNRFLSSQGRSVFIQEKSPEKSIKIVFIHGRCLSLRSWEHQFNSEQLNPFGLIAFDLFGHGSSAHTSDLYHYSLAGSVDLLVDLIGQLQLTNFFLAGHSLGGHVALQALSKLPTCQGVFCMTMPLTKPVDLMNMYWHVDLLGNVYQPNPTQADVSAYIDLLFQPNSSEKPPFVEADFRRTDPAVHTGILEGLLAENFQDEAELIRSSKKPVVIVQGVQEQVHKLDYLNKFDLPLWGKKPFLIPSAGHMVHWENPEPINKLLCAFINDNQQK